MSKFKPGDLAWSPHDGFAEIRSVSCNRNVWTIGHGENGYTADGKYYEHDFYPTLLTVEEAAKLGYYPLKKKVKKTIERWVNVYEYGLGVFYDSEIRANHSQSEGRIACVKLTGEYEVEE